MFFRDITDQKQAEARVLESERHFRAAFEQSVLGMLETSVDSAFTLVNDRLCEMLGYSREELSLLTSADVTHPDDVEKDLDAAAQMIAGRYDEFSTEKRYVRKDGSTLWVYLSVVAVQSDDGHVKYFLCAVETSVLARPRRRHSSRATAGSARWSARSPRPWAGSPRRATRTRRTTRCA